MGFYLIDLISLPLSKKMQEAYQNEIACGVNFFEYTVIFLQKHAKNAPQVNIIAAALSIFETITAPYNMYMESINDDRVIRNCYRLIVPFALLDCVELGSNLGLYKNIKIDKALKFVDDIFKKIPVFGTLKFAGITRICFLTIQYKVFKEQWSTRNDSKTTKSKRRTLSRKISLVQKTVKISTATLFLFSDLAQISVHGKNIINTSKIAFEIFCVGIRYGINHFKKC